MKLLVLAAALILGQAQIPYIETLDVTIHNIDVVVTDKSGKPVTGLRQEDFELLEDGKRKAITNFSAYTEEPPAAASTAPAAFPASGERVIPPEAARKIIFYVDEMALTDDSKKKLMAQLDAMVVQTMRPGDEAVVVRPTQEDRLGTGYTQDREAVRSWLDLAIRHQDWRSAPLQMEKVQFETDMKVAGPAVSRRQLARRWADMVRRRVKQRMGNLKSAVVAASALQGRKVMIVVTDSLPSEPGREAFRLYNDTLAYSPNDQTGMAIKGNPATDPKNMWPERGNPNLEYDWYDFVPMVKDIARTAASGGITIYALQPEVHLGSSAPGGGVDGPPLQLRTNSSINLMGGQGNSNIDLNDMLSNTETTMRILADTTGGTWFRGSGRIDDAVRVIATDVQSYYSIGYRASEGVDVAHKVEVRVKGRKDVTVRTRKEVVRKSPEQAMTDSVVAALVDPSVPSEIPLRLEVEMGDKSADGLSREVKVHALIPLSSLTFLNEGATHRARYTLHYAAMGKNAEFMSGVEQPQVIDVPAADLASAKEKYFRFILPLTMRPGKHDVVVGVMDSVSRVSGISRSEVTVN